VSVAKKFFIPDADAAFCSCCCGRLLFSPILRILLRVVGHAGSDFLPVKNEGICKGKIYITITNKKIYKL